MGVSICRIKNLSDDGSPVLFDRPGEFGSAMEGSHDSSKNCTGSGTGENSVGA